MSQQVRATKCKTISSSTMLFVGKEPGPMSTFTAHCIGSQLSLKPNFIQNYDKFRQKRGLKFFLIDEPEFARMEKIWASCKTEAERDAKTFEILGSVTNFSKYYEKNIYVRVIPTKAGSGEPFRVFGDEILEIIPVALMQQGTPIGANDARLSKYRREWHTGVPNWYNTISTDQFEEILEKFKIDKTKITLVEDPNHEISRQGYVAGGNPIRFISSDMKNVMDLNHARDMICAPLVMGVNWVNHRCPDSNNCKEKARAEVMGLLDVLSFMKSGTMLTWTLMNEMTKDSENNCKWSYKNDPRCPDYKMVGALCYNETNIHKYNAVTEFFDLPNYKNFLPNQNGETIPVWMFRMFCKLGFLQQFFSNEVDSEYSDVIIETVMLLVPPGHAAAARQFVVSIVKGKQENAQEEDAETSDGGAPADGFEKMLIDAMKCNFAIQKKEEAGGKK